VADSDLASGKSLLPPCKPAAGKRVAVIGAGPAGLAAAWHLLQEGVACTIFDDQDQPGGMLRRNVPEAELPHEVLDAEIALIARLGVEFRMRTRIGRDVVLADLQKDFDAMLIAAGSRQAAEASLKANTLLPEGAQTDRHTFQTTVRGLFAAGEAVHHHRMAVRAVAEGATAAGCILQFLAGRPVTAPRKPYTTRLHSPTPEEMARLVAGASAAGRVTPSGGEATGLTPEEARREAPRCLHCDCRKADACKLRDYCDAYSASPGRYHGTRRQFEQDVRHPDVVYEPGKCISCGLCIQIAARAKEPLGLAFIGRGFNVRVGTPFSQTVADGLQKAAADCVAACPTGALAHK
jgi:ferredoxin